MQRDDRMDRMVGRDRGGRLGRSFLARTSIPIRSMAPSQRTVSGCRPTSVTATSAPGRGLRIDAVISCSASGVTQPPGDAGCVVNGRIDRADIR
jgi:hypothetical protein